MFRLFTMTSALPDQTVRGLRMRQFSSRSVEPEDPAVAVSLPLTEGITSPTAFAAPVVVGMILTEAARPR